MKSLGISLQLFGFVVLPLGILAELSNAISLGQMLVMMLAGATAFYLGRMLEGYAR